MERNQIEINIQADDLVTEVIESAISQIMIWESRTPKSPENKYTKALKRLRIGNFTCIHLLTTWFSSTNNPTTSTVIHIFNAHFNQLFI